MIFIHTLDLDFLSKYMIQIWMFYQNIKYDFFILYICIFNQNLGNDKNHNLKNKLKNALYYNLKNNFNHNLENNLENHFNYNLKNNRIII